MERKVSEQGRVSEAWEEVASGADLGTEVAVAVVL